MKKTNSRPPYRPITQADIDAPLPPISRRCQNWREALEYLDGPPGGLLTRVVVLILFAAAGLALWAAWQLPVVRDAVTAIKG